MLTQNYQNFIIIEREIEKIENRTINVKHKVFFSFGKLIKNKNIVENEIVTFSLKWKKKIIVNIIGPHPL